MKKLILASSSPRRAELLHQIGIDTFEIVSPDIDETQKPKELVTFLVKRLATQKAQKIALTHKNTFILAADTVVAVGRRILGKPQDDAQEMKFLDLLSGRSHRVYTGFCIITPGGRVITKIAMSQVCFKNMSLDEKKWYIATRDWEGKSGGYGIQGKVSRFIPWIKGCHSNIKGLPVHEVYKVLSGEGFFS